MIVSSTVRRLAGYIVTGGTAAVIDLALFQLLVPVLGSVQLAALISVVIALGVNYTLSSRYAFRVEGSPRKASLFVLGACIGLVINVGVTTLVVALEVVPLAFAKLSGIGLAFIFNFLFNHLVVFPAPSCSK